MMGRGAFARKCVGQISPMKSRMGFHRRRWCCIVLVVRDDVECSGYTPMFKWVSLFRVPVPRIILSANPLLYEEASFSCPLDPPFVGAGSVPSFGVCVKRIR